MQGVSFWLGKESEDLSGKKDMTSKSVNSKSTKKGKGVATEFLRLVLI